MNEQEVKRASLTTKLKLMGIEAPVSLYKASADPKAKELETAGPNGGALRAKEEATEDEVPAERKDTPLPPLPETPAATVPGRYAQVLVEEGSGEVVAPDQVRKGVRLGDGTFVDLSRHLEKAEEETRLEALEVTRFIRRERVPRERIRSAYYLAAGDGEGFPPAPLLRALMEAMKASSRVAVVRWTKRKGQTLGILTVHGSGALMILELEWAENMRVPNDRCLTHLHAQVSVPQVERTIELIQAMSGSRADSLDDLRDARVEMEAKVIADAYAGKLEDAEKLEAPAVDEGMEDLERVLAASVEEARA